MVFQQCVICSKEIVLNLMISVLSISAYSALFLCINSLIAVFFLSHMGSGCSHTAKYMTLPSLISYFLLNPVHTAALPVSPMRYGFE